MFSIERNEWTLMEAPRNLVPEAAEWNRQGHLVGLFADRFGDTLWHQDRPDGGWTSIPLDRLSPVALVVSDSGDDFVVAADPYHPTRLYRIEHKVGAPKLIFDPNPRFEDFAFGEQRRVTWLSRTGEEGIGLLILPPNYQPGRKYPCIIDVYPTTPTDNLRLMPAAQMGQIQASWGYIIFVPQLRSPQTPYVNNRGEEYIEKARGARGVPVMLEDYRSAIRYLTGTGLVDRNRIGVFGHSNGGIVAMYLAGEPETANCFAISSPAGGNSFASVLLLPRWQEPGRRITTLSEFIHGEVTDNPQEYLELSPVFRMGRRQVPILLMGGDRDPFCTLQAIMAFNQAASPGSDITLVRYANEGHVVRTAENAEDWNERIHRFFDTHLK